MAATTLRSTFANNQEVVAIVAIPKHGVELSVAACILLRQIIRQAQPIYLQSRHPLIHHVRSRIALTEQMFHPNFGNP